MKNKYLAIFYCLLSVTITAVGQSQFPWPVTPFNSSQLITGNFCEYRSTSASGHFHNGTDIPKADGSPVYASKSGTITDILDQTSNAFVRVNDLAYVHIQPNPSLSVGDQVIASQTILGTILPGLGHVHLTNGFSGAERNSMLPNSGLTPYVDTWTPIIRYTRFFKNNSNIAFQSDTLSGPVDIIVKVDERNGPNGSSTSVLNNGTYKIGYKILSADTSTVVYEPPNGGLRFQFNVKPSNSYVNIAFYRPLSSTSSHVYQVTNNLNSDNYWDTTVLPPDKYVVMVFTEDTRSNTDTMYTPVVIEEQDITPPDPPLMRFVRETGNGVLISWYGNTEPDLRGYRMYFSFDNISWNLFKDESVLTAAVTDTLVPGILNRDIYFRLSAVDNAPLPNVSDISDTYGMSNGNFSRKVLVVDGFDRTTGGWPLPHHGFVATHAKMLKDFDISFDSAPNEALLDGSVVPADYDALIWISGDEADLDETFSAAEQMIVSAYLENGGNLFVSGSEIAWDLAVSDSVTVGDQQFLQDYLKAGFVEKDTLSQTATGEPGGIFDGLSLNVGAAPYAVEPDVITAGGSMATLRYGGGGVAGVQYTGTFGNGSTPGKLVYLAFPFETIATESARTEVMSRVMFYFFGTTGIADGDTETGIGEFALLPNYPNPFNPTTTLRIALPQRSEVQLVIFNAIGQKVRTLLKTWKPAGIHEIVWDGRSDSGGEAPSGIYFARLQTAGGDRLPAFTQTQKMLLLK